MAKLHKLQCEQCAGKIDGATLTCQSCGMQYRLDEDMCLTRIVSSNLRWTTIGGAISLPSYVLFEMGEQTAAEMTLKEMTNALAPKLLPFMELQSAFDPKYNSLVTYGRIRVAEPLVNQFGKVSLTMPDLRNLDWHEV